MAIEILEQLLANPTLIQVVRGFGIATLRAVFGYVEHWINQPEGTKWSWRKFFQTWFRMAPQVLGWSAATGIPEISFLTDIFITKAAKAVEIKKE